MEIVNGTCTLMGKVDGQPIRDYSMNTTKETKVE